MSKRVLVVGGAGYIGSHCTRFLEDAGVEVVVYDNLSTGHAEAVRSELVVGDIRDRDTLLATLQAQPFDAVLQFAALCLVGESQRLPVRYFDVNVGGTLSLLDCMIRADVGALVFSSTCAVYGTPHYLPLDEVHPKGPMSVYGQTKWMVEQVLDEVRERQDLSIASLRYFNAAGAHPDGSLGESHDPESHLIPLALDAVLGRRPHLKVFGRDYDTRDGTCVRDYIHVLDLADAHHRALLHLWDGSAGGAWNLGTGHGTTVLEILQGVARVTGQPMAFGDAPRRDGDPPGLYAVAERAKADLGWIPSYTNIDDVIETAWRWAQEPRF
jgi:UDP-glucose 4-epimerase